MTPFLALLIPCSYAVICVLLTFLLYTSAKGEAQVLNKFSMAHDGKEVLTLPAQGGAASAAVILIHGLGDSAQGWASGAMQLQEHVPHAKFVLPTAPTSPVTLNGGYKMTSWYDIESLDNREAEKAAGLEESREYIAGLVAKEIAGGIPANRIVVSGFSQGGAMSLVFGLQHTEALAGVVSMSGYLVAADRFTLSAAGKGMPTLMCHGTDDAVVKHSWGLQSRAKLEEQGIANLQFKEYPGMGHSSCPQEMSDVGAFLKARIPAL